MPSLREIRTAGVTKARLEELAQSPDATVSRIAHHFADTTCSDSDQTYQRTLVPLVAYRLSVRNSNSHYRTGSAAALVVLIPSHTPWLGRDQIRLVGLLRRLEMPE